MATGALLVLFVALTEDFSAAWTDWSSWNGSVKLWGRMTQINQSIHVSADVWQWWFSTRLVRAPQIHPAKWVGCGVADLRRPGEQQAAQVSELLDFYTYLRCYFKMHCVSHWTLWQWISTNFDQERLHSIHDWMNTIFISIMKKIKYESIRGLGPIMMSSYFKRGGEVLNITPIQLVMGWREWLKISRCTGYDELEVNGGGMKMKADSSR